MPKTLADKLLAALRRAPATTAVLVSTCGPGTSTDRGRVWTELLKLLSRGLVTKTVTRQRVAIWSAA